MGCYPVLYKYKAKMGSYQFVVTILFDFVHPSLRSFNSSDGINTKNPPFFRIQDHIELVIFVYPIFIYIYFREGRDFSFISQFRLRMHHVRIQIS